MKQNGISIRYKILLLLTIIPLAALITYSGIALRVFEQDKIAYVYETSSTVTRTLSQQATTDFISVLGEAKPALQECILQNNFSTVSQSILDSNTNLQWFAAFVKDPQTNQFVLKSSLPNKGINADTEIKNIAHLQEILAEAMTKSRVVKNVTKDSRVLFVEKATNDMIFLISADLKDLAGSLSDAGSVEVYLVNDTGEVILGPEGAVGNQFQDKTGPDLLTQLSGQKFQGGTEQYTTPKGEDLLVSNAKVNFGNLNVISLVNKNDALGAVKILLRKSILFLVLLVCLIVIVSLLAAGRLTQALTELFSATKKIAEGNFQIRVAVKSSDEVGSLATSFNTMAGEVERLMSETAEKARMESELKTAQTVQETLFPASHATMGNIEISGHYEPASECGGDWWHYSEVGDKVYFWIGDATGHGAPAALITSAARSAASVIESLNLNVNKAMELLNRAVYDVSKGKLMMTFFIASLDKKTGVLNYANASHEGPYLIHKNEALKKKDLVPLIDVNNFRLGQDRNTIYQMAEIKLQPNDRIFFYTDGIPDIQNPAHEYLGERNFIKAIIESQNHFPGIEQSLALLKKNFSDFRQNTVLLDDVTFFMVEYKG